MQNFSHITNQFEVACFKNSFFITLEGIEGSGKSTHIKELTGHLEANNFRVVLLREPGGTTFGENLRNAILDSKKKITPISEAYLFAASRAQLLNEHILPNLKIEKTCIICDRYIDSSIAYQGIARGLGIETILNIHTYSPLNIMPNLTLYLKISLNTSLKRQEIRGSKKDYFESQKKDFYKKLIQGYDAAGKSFPNRIKVIDGENEIKKVYDDLLQPINNLLGIS